MFFDRSYTGARDRGTVDLNVRKQVIGSADNLADLLYNEVSTRFSMELEDESELEVAQWIIDLHQSLGRRDIGVLEQIRQHSGCALGKCSGQTMVITDAGETVTQGCEDSSSETSDECP